MTLNSRRRSFAQFLKRFPWLVTAAYPFYQLTRAGFTLGVVGVVFDAESRVLLAEHVYHPLVPWGLPGGSVSRGEDPAFALAREYREELAMTVRVIEPLLIERTYFRHVDLAFLCHTESLPEVSSGEILSAAFFSADALPAITQFQYRALMRAYQLVEIEPRLSHDLP